MLGCLAITIGIYHIGGQDTWTQWLPSIVTAVALYANAIVTMTLEDTLSDSSNVLLDDVVGDEKDTPRVIYSAKASKEMYSNTQPMG